MLRKFANGSGGDFRHGTSGKDEADLLVIPGKINKSLAFGIVKFTAKLATVTLAVAAVDGIIVTAFPAIAAAILVSSTPVFLGVGLAVTVIGIAAVGKIATGKLPAMSWDNIEKVLDQVTDMANVKLSLSGISKALDNLKKRSKIAVDGTPATKSDIKKLVATMRPFSKIFNAIYGNSVGCARASVGYASASLKKHLMANGDQQEIPGNDEFIKDLTFITDTFDDVDKITDPVYA